MSTYDPEYQAAYRAAHRDELAAKQRARMARLKLDPQWMEAERARDNAYQARAKAADPDGYACRRAFEHASQAYGSGVTFEEFQSVWLGQCFDCGVTPARGVDHIVGWSRDGTNDVENLQPSCLTCNKRKAVREREARKNL